MEVILRRGSCGQQGRILALVSITKGSKLRSFTDQLWDTSELLRFWMSPSGLL